METDPVKVLMEAATTESRLASGGLECTCMDHRRSRALRILVEAMAGIRDFDRAEAVAFGMHAFARLTNEARKALAAAAEEVRR